MTKYYFIRTYGCQMNVHESEKLAGMAKECGYLPCENTEQADLIIFNTCCIRETAETKILGHIGQVKRLKKKKPSLIVAVCGCMTQQPKAAEVLSARFPFLDIILGTHNLARFGEILKTYEQKNKVREITENDELTEGLPVYRTSGVNAWVNIIYGCNNFCTYCIVPYVRGREHSRQKAEILAETQSLIQKGYREITLLGQNVNSYGKDLQDGSNFADLLQSLANLDGKFRLRFMTSHPKDLSDDVIDVIANNEKICNSIHLPVQSGSNRILEKMNRRYTREKYLELTKKIRSKVPNVGFSSDIMIGFPGETEEDFCETLNLVREAQFYTTFDFVYSPRKGTPAAEMADQIPPEIKKDRIERLISVQNEVTKDIGKAMIGKTEEILVEGTQPKYPDVYCGRTDSGKLVNFASEKNLIGQFVNVEIDRCRSTTLWGKLK